MTAAKWTLGALGLALLVALLLAPFASTSPDGLETVAAGKAGFADKFEEPSVAPSPLPDYEVPGVGNQWVSTAVAGAVGTLAAFGLMLGIGRLLTVRRAQRPDPEE
jgi:cobalt/nickel transport protein